MFLQALATATPTDRFTQRECWDVIAQSEARKGLKDRSLKLLQKVLLNDSGIDYRHFALSNLSRIFDYKSEELALGFEREGPALAARALATALEKAGLLPGQLDALFICTCTGYLCPGLTSHVAESLGLKADAYLHDAVGIGCGAAIPVLRAADHFLAANPDATAACIAVEICSAAFYLDDDPGVLISACLFGDGAAATLWTGRGSGQALRASGFDTLHWPQHRERLRFTNSGGKLRNRLDKSVPGIAAQAVQTLFDRRGPGTFGDTIAHPGGKDVLTALRTVLPADDLADSAHVLRQFGNMSSPSVLFALGERLARRPVENDLWLVSFGAGFSCHSCRIGPPES
jgi:alkylresorcinol/alkylpyrone synthase